MTVTSVDCMNQT